MLHSFHLASLCAAAAFAAAPCLGAQIPHPVCVVDETGAPISGVRAFDNDSRLVAISDATGRLPVRSHEAALRLERIGFRPELIHRDSVTRSGSCVVLEAVSNSLPAVVVADTRSPTIGQSITRQTAQRAPALAEPDLFRSLPLAAGVTQSNDLRATVRLAGGATDETGVTLDGYPLQWPFHASSAFSAFNVSALERADIAIAHLAPSENDWLAGRIALVPRIVRERAEGEVDASLLSTTATLATPGPLGTTALATGRITYLGALMDRVAPSRDEAVPTYRDLLVRIAKGDSTGWSVSSLVYGTADERRSRYDESDGTRWGELLLGIRTAYAGSMWRLGAQVSTDRTSLRDGNASDRPPAYGSLPAPITGHHIALQQRWTSATVHADWIGARVTATVGQAFDARDHDWNWNSSTVRTLLTPSAPFTLNSRQSQARQSTFANASFVLPLNSSLTGGARATRFQGQYFLSPRMVLETSLTPRLDVALVAERRFQYDAIPEELNIGGLLPPVALLQAPRRADALAITGNYQFTQTADRHATLRTALYHRRYTDRPVLVGQAAASDDAWPYSRFMSSTAVADGASVSGELVHAGGPTVQATYTLQRVRERVAGSSRPTAWDAPQNLNAFVAVPLGGAWTASMVGQFHSGTAITPAEFRGLVPTLTSTPSYAGRLYYGAPNSARLPAYRRIDVGVRRTWSRAGAEWTLSVQAINVLNRRNLLSYDLESYYSCGGGAHCGSVTGDRSLPFVPSLALQVRW